MPAKHGRLRRVILGVYAAEVGTGVRGSYTGNEMFTSDSNAILVHLQTWFTYRFQSPVIFSVQVGPGPGLSLR